jgi:hypothetical protein
VPANKVKVDTAGLHFDSNNPPAPPPPPLLQLPPPPPPATNKNSVAKPVVPLVEKAPEPLNTCCVLQETHETVPPAALCGPGY